MTAVASALASAASHTDPDAQPFAYKVRFEHPYTPGAGNPPSFEMTGQFERLCDQNESLALGWGYAQRETDRAYAAIVPLEPIPDCPNRHATETVYSFPAAEPEADHQPIHDWRVDFPQIAETLKKNHAEFVNGLETIEVTTARRLKLDDARSTGCVRTVYSRIGHHRLDGNNDSRTVMELIEAGLPARRASLAGYCTAGHYIILDAAMAEVLERGKYQRCEYFASDQI